MIYLILAAAIAFGGFYVGYEWQAGVIAKRDAKIAEADAKLQASTAEAIQAAANNITDMQAAYDAGEQNAKQTVRTVYVKGQAIASADKGIANPVCVADPSSVLYLNRARAGMFAAADSGGTVATVSAPGGLDRRDVPGTVSNGAAGHGAMGPVHTDAGAASDGGQVSTTGVSAHPKPKPIGK